MRLIALSSIAVLALAGLLGATAARADTATTNDDVDVYSARSFSADVVNSVDADTDVDVQQCRGNWCKLHIPGPDGWVRKQYLDFGDAGPTPPPAPTPPPLPYGPDTCADGFVWRDAIPGDHVCVVPGARATAATENASAGAHVDPAGAYGPNSCIAGYVWREAYTGDVVCVVPPRRTAVTQENADGPSHRAVH